jgi:hypothetical protein
MNAELSRQSWIHEIAADAFFGRMSPLEAEVWALRTSPGLSPRHQTQQLITTLPSAPPTVPIASILALPTAWKSVIVPGISKLFEECTEKNSTLLGKYTIKFFSGSSVIRKRVFAASLT